MFRSVAVNFSILTAGQVGSGLLAFLFIAFVARHFGPELFGKYILIGTYVRLVSLIVSAGVTPIAVRELALLREDRTQLHGLFDDILSMNLALGATGYLALIGVVLAFGRDSETLLLMAVAGLPLILESFTSSYTAYHTAHERMAMPSIFSVVLTATSVAVGTVVLLTGAGLLALFISSAVMSSLGTVIWTVIFRRMNLRFRLRARFSAWRRILMHVIPFLPIYVSNQLNRVLNIFLLGRLTGPLPMAQSVGYYSPAQSIINAAVMTVMGLRRVLIPPVTVRLGQGYTVTGEIDLALKLVVAVFCLPLVLGTAFMAPEIIAILFGDQYAPSASVLVILGWAGALQIAAMVPESFLFAHPEHNIQDYIFGAVVSVLVNAVLCVLLIADYGVAGAAVAAVTTRLVYFLFAAHYCRRQMQVKALQLRRFGDVILLVLLSCGAWYLVKVSIANVWVAYSIATAFTLTFLGGFMLYLRYSLANKGGSEDDREGHPAG